MAPPRAARPGAARRRAGPVLLLATTLAALRLPRAGEDAFFQGVVNKAKQQQAPAASAPGPCAGADPTVELFEAPERAAAYQELEKSWAAEFEALKSGGKYPDIARDPYFELDKPALLRRYLVSTQYDTGEALTRLKATAKWRRDWDVMAYYEPGAARELFGEDTNPGSEMYFADAQSTDKYGRPWVAGRLKFANPESMHPWRHLRAGVLVFELMAHKVALAQCGPASYVLDIGAVGNVQGTVSGTGGLDKEYDETVNPYYKRDAGITDAPSPAMLEEFGNLNSGFAVLKAAIQILNKHYPGTMDKVYYLNSDMLFWGAFKIFSRWIADRGSITFSFLGPAGWREDPVSKLLDTYPADHLFREWGGSGPSLDNDAFLARAIEAYEVEASERAKASPGKSAGKEKMQEKEREKVDA